MRGWRTSLRLSLREASHVLGLRPRQVRQLVEAGELDGEVVAGSLLIVTSSLVRRFDQGGKAPLKADAQRAVAWAAEE